MTDDLPSIEEIARTKRTRDDKPFNNAHRLASEGLILATEPGISKEGCLKAIEQAERYGQLAVDAAQNRRELALANGLLQTCVSLKSVICREDVLSLGFRE